MNPPRVFGFSKVAFIFISIVFVILFSVLFFSFQKSPWFIAFITASGLGLTFLYIGFLQTSKIIVSDDEITSQNILGATSLRWTEIVQLSGKNFNLKLHNQAGDTTVSLHYQLPLYEELIEIIYQKRPDLFNSENYPELSMSWWQTISLPLMGMGLIFISIFFFLISDSGWFGISVVLILGVFLTGLGVTALQSIYINPKSLVLHYLFSDKTIPAHEIKAVTLKYAQTRSGKNYYVSIERTTGKDIRFSAIQPNLPIAYLVLKNWHAKQ